MQHLHPRAFLLFFLRYLFRYMWLPVALGVAAILALVYLPDLISLQTSSTGSATLFIAYLIAVVLLGTLVFAWLVYRSYRFELGDEGYHQEQGIIFKQSVTIPYSHIEDVEISRQPLLRLLGLSGLRIQTAGSSERVAGESFLVGLDRTQGEQLQSELVRRCEEHVAVHAARATGQAPAPEPSEPKPEPPSRGPYAPADTDPPADESSPG